MPQSRTGYPPFVGEKAYCKHHDSRHREGTIITQNLTCEGDVEKCEIP